MGFMIFHFFVTFVEWVKDLIVEDFLVGEVIFLVIDHVEDDSEQFSMGDALIEE